MLRLSFLLFTFLQAFNAALFAQPFAEPFGQREAAVFIRAFLSESDSVASWIHPDELRRCHRLGIRYDGARHKALIGIDLDSTLRAAARRGDLAYTFQLEPLTKTAVRLTLTFPALNAAKVFYFTEGKWNSAFSYHTAQWTTHRSRYFQFLMSDRTRFNPFAADRLDKYVDSICRQLGISEADKAALAREKIFYALCQDERETELLTGFKTLGLSLLAQDAIVSIYPAHQHELVHLLVNFRLRTLPLYTHPFLQEGLAVALGGRGGKAAGVTAELGAFIETSNLLSHQTLLSRDGFFEQDASMSYPVSGLYTSFLLRHLGAEKFLALYRRYSFRTAADMPSIPAPDLPDETAWQTFLSRQQSLIKFELPRSRLNAVLQCDSADAALHRNSLYFSVKSSMLLAPKTQSGSADSAGSNRLLAGYTSRIFAEKFPNRRYQGEKYLITATATEISVYHLYTGDLLATFVAAFSRPAPVRSQLSPIQPPGDKFRFSVPASVFDEALTDLELR